MIAKAKKQVPEPTIAPLDPKAMTEYVGTKVLLAQPITRGAYNAYRGWTVPEDENPDDEGYLVEYTDGGKANHPDHKGYISWSPKDVFERAYHPTKDYGDLADYQKRVMMERDELNDRISKLDSFIATSPTWWSLVQEEQARLKQQLLRMAQYLDVLDQRIAAWSVK